MSGAGRMLIEQMFERFIMSRKYTPAQGSISAVRLMNNAPASFTWRNCRYGVTEVLLNWLEPSNLLGQVGSQIWRVEAGPILSKNLGVYDLAASQSGWFIRRVLD